MLKYRLSRLKSINGNDQENQIDHTYAKRATVLRYGSGWQPSTEGYEALGPFDLE